MRAEAKVLTVDLWVRTQMFRSRDARAMGGEGDGNKNKVRGPSGSCVPKSGAPTSMQAFKQREARVTGSEMYPEQSKELQQFLCPIIRGPNTTADKAHTQDRLLANAPAGLKVGATPQCYGCS